MRNGCLRASDAVILFAGSVARHLSRKLTKSWRSPFSSKFWALSFYARSFVVSTFYGILKIDFLRFPTAELFSTKIIWFWLFGSKYFSWNIPLLTTFWLILPLSSTIYFKTSELFLPSNKILPVYTSNNVTPALQISISWPGMHPRMISGAL